MSDTSPDISNEESAPSHLRALEEQPEAEAPAELAAEEEAKRGGGLLWLLGLALLVCAIFLVMQVQKTGELEAQVEALGAELSVASEALSAAEASLTRYELRMDEVRGSVGELLSRVGSLQELVDRDPTADAPGVPLSE